MIRTIAALGPLLALAACGDGTYGYSGRDMSDYFPFDGERVWEFVSTNPDVPYKSVAVLDPAYRQTEDGKTWIFQVSHHKECVTAGADCVTDEPLFAYEMSSDDSDGVLIWSYAGPDGQLTTFDPPLMVADSMMVAGDEVVTETNGTAYTAKFVGMEHCPIRWTDGWEDCAKISISEANGAWPSGDLWAISGWNQVAWKAAGQDDQWQLSWADYSPLE